MSKKHKNTYREDKTSSQYYQLKTEAIDTLVKANKDPESIIEEYADNSEITADKRQEAKSYQKSTFLNKLPVWLKALVIKWWFNGVACFFFYWGLGNVISAPFDLLFVLTLAMGVLTDILVNTILRFLNSGKKEYDAYMMTPPRKFWTLFVNIAYACLVMSIVWVTYNTINVWIINAGGLDPDTVPFGVEPISFALIYLAFDMIFILFKNMIVSLVRKSKKSSAKNISQQTTGNDEQ